MPDAKTDVVSRLRIMDIALWECHLTRQVEYPHVEGAADLVFQTMRGVRVDSVGGIAEDGSELDILKVFVELGIRCIQRAESGDEVVLHTLESVFSVDYACEEPVDEDEIADFANFNSVHNVWPFWRQHVYDTMKNASLPVPEIPFFPGQKSKAKEAGGAEE